MATVITPIRPTVIRPFPRPVTIRPSVVIRIQPVAVTRIIPRPIEATRIVPLIPTIVRPPGRGAWAERGWARRTENGKSIYEGSYQVGSRRYQGRVEVERRGRISAFIHNPPPEIRRHRHRACFQQLGVGTGWFTLHWRRAPGNVDEAILYFEQVLDESINQR